MAAEKQKPVQKIRSFPVQAAIWRNETKNGAFHTVTFSRSYKDEKGEYHDTDSFSGTQLLQLARLAGKAYDRAEALNRAARAEQEDGQDDDVTEYDQETGEVEGDDDLEDQIPF